MVERVTIGAEIYRRLLQSAALHIQHVVDDDAVEPGAEAAPTLERREPGQGFDEDLLRRVLGVLGMREHADGDIVDPSLMPLDEFSERLAIARAGARYEGAILKVGGSVVGEGVSDAHGSSLEVRRATSTFAFQDCWIIKLVVAMTDLISDLGQHLPP